MEKFTQFNQPQDRQLLLLLNLIIVILGLVCVALIFLTIAGYGMARLNLPNNVSVSINGQPLTSRLVRLRPGSYQVVVSSPNITPYQSTLRVSLFQTVVFNPVLVQRSADSIASSVIGSVGAGGVPPQLGFTQWFDNNTWAVGLVVPGNSDLALHYDNNKMQWEVGFYNGGGYPDDLTTLPANVAAYVVQLETQHAGG